MSEDRQPEQELFRAALGPGKSCPPVEELARLIDEPSGAGLPPTLADHVQSCSYCRNELHLLQTFLSAETPEEDIEAVRFVTEQLRTRSAEIFARPVVAPAQPTSWWSTLFALPWLRPSAFTMAAVLIVVAIGFQLRFAGPPALRPLGGSGAEVLRSHTLDLLTPKGDLQQAPREIQWQPSPGAVKYEVRLLEVDRTEMWKTETAQTRVELPSPVQARIVPAKTILCEVAAFDAAGRKVAESELVRFRLLQKVYSR
jgi:hypothetical protein